MQGGNIVHRWSPGFHDSLTLSGLSSIMCVDVKAMQSVNDCSRRPRRSLGKTYMHHSTPHCGLDLDDVEYVKIVVQMWKQDEGPIQEILLTREENTKLPPTHITRG
jgi:hypothetical protein